MAGPILDNKVSVGRAFLESALAREGAFLPLGDVPAWLAERQAAHRFEVRQIPFAELRGWRFDLSSGDLAHESGRFFTIAGISVETNFGPVPAWSQPIIHQPEVGCLGIVASRFDGVLHFLMQAKMEPGNVNMVQLAPTLQATKSNLARVHGGRVPKYAEYFTGDAPVRVLVDVLQSEQGARFLRKRNRNTIVETEQDVGVDDDCCWLTLGQIHELARQDNLVNMDARTVLGCIPFSADGPAFTSERASGGSLPRRLLRSIVGDTPALHDFDEIVRWFTRLKLRYELEVQRIPLKDVRDWRRDEMDISHREERFFSVIAVEAAASNREVGHWTQPLVKPREEGLVAFIVRDIDGVLHFLVQAKVEPGNLDVIELAPTVQCTTGSYRQARPDQRPPFLDVVLNAEPDQVVFETLQSEEGGRFFREVNRNVVVAVSQAFPLDVPENYTWMTLSQLKMLIRFNNFVNVECRCLLGSLGLAAGGPQ